MTKIDVLVLERFQNFYRLLKCLSIESESRVSY